MTRYFTKDHEWIEVEGDTGTVGITDFAQSQLGDITFVELPDEGKSVSQGDSVSVVDSVKAASDVYTPVSGTVTEGNEAAQTLYACCGFTVFGVQPNAIRVDGHELAKVHMALRLR